MALPLGAAPGAITKITIRGLKLDGATAVRFQDGKVTAKILSKGKAAVPNMIPPERMGNTQVVVEVTLPKRVTAGSLPFMVVTPGGETKPHPLLVEAALPVVAEKEPNDGFRQAQKIKIPQVVQGTIDRPKDVDVFRFEGKAGMKIVCEVLAARYGSGLDSILTLYDAGGHEVASNDDTERMTDSRLEVALPKTGTYYLSLIDAHDQGGPTHPYRLVVKQAK
jgi:hypothetical protein